MNKTINYRIDNLQYCNWSKEIFKINREAKLDAVHVTVVYHEDFEEFKDQREELKKVLKSSKYNYSEFYVEFDKLDIKREKKKINL